MSEGKCMVLLMYLLVIAYWVSPLVVLLSISFNFAIGLLVLLVVLLSTSGELQILGPRALVPGPGLYGREPDPCRLGIRMCPDP